MANNKTGFDYYNVQTNRYMDIRIKRLKKHFKGIGIAVYDFILCEVYRTKGYYLEWDEHVLFDIADFWDISEDEVNKILNFCCSIGLFDKESKECKNIITSKSIQDRWVEMSIRAKRNVKIPEESYKLTEEYVIIHEESQQNTGSLPQSKAKQSKEEKSKETSSSLDDNENTDDEVSFEKYYEDNTRNFKRLVELITEFKITGPDQETILEYTEYGLIGSHGFKRFMSLTNDVRSSGGNIKYPDRYIMANVLKDLVSKIKL